MAVGASSPVSTVQNGAGPADPSVQSRPAPAGRVLDAKVGGHTVIGQLVFCGVTERSPKQLAVDVMCKDADGRMEVVRTSGWVSSNEGQMTPLGIWFASGNAAGLIGSEVAVAVRPRVKDNRLYFGVEGVYPVSRSV